MTSEGRRGAIRPPTDRLSLALAALAAVLALLQPHPLGRAVNGALAVAYASMALPRVALRPGHLEVWSARGRRRVPWSEVRAVRALPTDVVATALLADGSRVRLPGLRWEPLGRTAAPLSARDAVAYAREHGHDVELVEEPEGDAAVRDR